MFHQPGDRTEAVKSAGADKTGRITPDYLRDASLLKATQHIMFVQLLIVAILGLALGSPAEREKRQVDCPNTFHLTSNPCVSGQSRVFYPIAGDTTKFVQCDVLGHAYVVQCPTGFFFNEASSTCHEEVAVVPTVGTNSLCNSQAIASGRIYFAFSGDNTKFWECIAVGQAQVLTCPSQLLFDAARSACVYVSSSGVVIQPTTVSSTEIGNPCTVQQLASGNHYFAHPDPTRFIQCDDAGEAFVVTCPSRLVWNQYLQTCVSAYSTTIG